MKQKTSKFPPVPAPAAGRLIIVWLVMAVLVAGIAWWLWPIPPAPTPLAGSAPTSAPATAADYSPLVGKWQRSDGDYIIEILSAAPDGKLEAKYYNPGPINVGKAMGMIDGGKLTALVELRDVNYPGSTYRLRHDVNKMTGEYFQATQGETFQVEFTRVP